MTNRLLLTITFLIGALFVVVGSCFQFLNINFLIFSDITFISIGCSMLATGIYNKVFFHSNGILQDYYNSIHNVFGIERIYKNRTYPDEDCIKIITDSNQELCALGHTLNRLIQQKKNYLVEAARRGVAVKILALDAQPIIDNSNLFREKASFLRQRKAEETLYGIDIPECSTECLVAAINEMNEEIGKTCKGKIELKFYYSFPVNSMLFNEKEMIAGGFFHKKESGSSYTLKLLQGEIYSQHSTHFYNLWNDNRFVHSLEEATYTGE